ncbi:cell envelope biogenesis protein OmpA, partial [Phreatobacter sp. AB_2022a]|nr:cell envelope biogenesis protein OmpA [Phreatobacter sp. AB_2022a]
MSKTRELLLAGTMLPALTLSQPHLAVAQTVPGYQMLAQAQNEQDPRRQRPPGGAPQQQRPPEQHRPPAAQPPQQRQAP